MPKVQREKKCTCSNRGGCTSGRYFAGGQNIPAQQKTWNAGDTKRTQMTESATQRMDLTDAFAVILQGATKKFIEECSR